MASRPTSRSIRATVAALALALALGACSTNSATPGPTATRAPSATQPASSAEPSATRPAGSPAPSGTPGSGRLSITFEPFASVPGGPLAITAPDDGTGRLFVAAQDGTIWVVEADGSVLPDPMIDLGPRLRSGGEQGLLGLAVHPQFPTDPRAFVNYTDTAGDTVIASLELDPADPNRLLDSSHEQLLFIDQPYANHNGGGVLFGPDGYLYLSLGDGGSGGDPQDNGQRTDSLLGKILRIDVDGGDQGAGGGYGIPSDNPFANSDGFDEIWHFGLRNPWRLSFDRETGDLWIGDVGQGLFEEIDVARAGVGGLNFGWKVMEGNHCYGDEPGCDTAGLTGPITEYGRDLGCTVIGGYVYRGAAYPFLVGTYLFADYCEGRILAIDAGATEFVEPTTVGAGNGQISAFGEDVDGELYVTNLSGTVSRVVATQR
jgi:glucose/arabinose dehydrogenase